MHRRLPFVLLAILLLQAATAQGPANEQLAVSTADGESVYVVSRDRQETFEVIVRYESDNPFDAQQERRVEMQASDLPEGWAASFAPAAFGMTTTDGTATQRVAVTITLGAQARQAEAPLTITAAMAERGASEVPVVGGELDPALSAGTTVTLQREDAVTRELLEGLGPWVWLVLAALGALAVALVVMLVRGNRVAVRMHSDVAEAHVAPGKSVAVPVTVENLTKVEDTVVFHVGPMPEGWAAHLPVPELELDGKQVEELHLIISAPKDAEPGSRLSAGISAHSAQAPRKVVELVVAVHVADTSEARAAGGKK